MAKAWIQEYGRVSRDMDNIVAQAPQEPAVASQTVAFTTSTQSAAFSDKTVLVRILADAECRLAFGADPTADDDSLPLPAGASEYFGVKAGDKVAIFEAAGGE